MRCQAWLVLPCAFPDLAWLARIYGHSQLVAQASSLRPCWQVSGFPNRAGTTGFALITCLRPHPRLRKVHAGCAKTTLHWHCRNRDAPRTRPKYSGLWALTPKVAKSAATWGCANSYYEKTTITIPQAHSVG